MDPTTAKLTPTSYALLGQLALRSWSVYEMTLNVGRTLHWFWPRAESVLYEETKRLAELGLATATPAPGRRGRPQTVYAITPAGESALATWLATTPGGFTLHFEALLRVHLSPYGSRDDLVRALEVARDEAASLVRQAMVIGTEFVEGRHRLQNQVNVRAILFDYLWAFGLSMYLWADRWIGEVSQWPDLEPTAEADRKAVELIGRCLDDLPPGLAIAGEPVG
jgi:DNA-binding PadR family transcriptional regulator